MDGGSPSDPFFSQNISMLSHICHDRLKGPTHQVSLILNEAIMEGCALHKPPASHDAKHIMRLQTRRLLRDLAFFAPSNFG